MSINPEDHYVHLAPDGTGSVVSGGKAFWSLPPEVMAKFERGWVVSEFVCDEDWKNWEMHPDAEELVYLLSGRIDFLQQTPDGVTTTSLDGRGAILVPRGVWHTARVYAPSRMLFVTMGVGTQHKPHIGA